MNVRSCNNVLSHGVVTCNDCHGKGHRIESAPEMLEALEDILQRLEDDLFLAGVPREQHKDQRHLKRLYKAIAKAKGQTSLSPQDKQGEV